MAPKKPEVVIVTGASAGVGRAVVREFGKHGAYVGLIARGRAGLEAARREVEDLGGRAVTACADVADYEALRRAAERIEKHFGVPDIWINCAMSTVFGDVRDVTPEEFRRVTDVTYHGYVWGTKIALERMRRRGRGTIVQVGSALAYRGIPLQSAYCGAKHAIQGFTESLRTELRYHGSRIHVTSVHLPGLNTPQFDWQRNKMRYRAQPVPPIFQPEVAARAIYWAAHRRRREVWVGWPTVKTIVGNRTVPWYVEWYLARNVYDGQQTDDPALDRPDNLFRPVAGDHGAHGRFDDRSKPRSVQTWFSRHRLLAGVGGVALLAGAAGVAARAGAREAMNIE